MGIVAAASKVGDASTRKLLGDLAEAERKHVTLAQRARKNAGFLSPLSQPGAELF
jgi:rubrerythrin